MQKLNDFSRSLIALEPDGTLIAVIEMSLSSWLVAGIVPGVERQPLKKLAVDESALLKLLHRWREEAEKAGRRIERIAVAFEAGRDGFWLARWLKARSIEAHVIHAASVAVSREHRRAKTDRLDTELLKRAFLGWLRGERDHCKMVAIPSIKNEDAKRPNRERENLVSEQTRIINRMKAALIRLGIRGFNPKLKRAAGRLEDLRTPEDEPIPPNTLAELRRDMERRRLVRDQIRQIEEARLERLDHAPDDGPHAMVRLLARVIGVGIETADMLVHEVLSRNMRDRRAVARYAGLTGSPDESGRKRREKGLARSGNGRVRRGMIQLAWRFLMHQKNSALAQWFRARTANAPGTRKTMIVALARKLLIALWRLVRQGVVPDGVVLRPAQ
ncbi:MAG TPA: IS110 family transposase [Bradyrhizobium sp.]|nr:IS110 family transposase [Bradyrhizobium sp.]